MKKNLLLTTTLIALIVASCKKAPQATMQFQNRTPDAVTLTINGEASTLPANDTMTLLGNVGDLVEYSAVTIADEANGVPSNAIANWKGKIKYNPEGVTSQVVISSGLADPKSFHLVVMNQSGQTFDKLVVKSSEAATDSTTYTVNIPADGVGHPLGYYPIDSFTVVNLYNSNTLYSHNTVYGNDSVKYDAYYNITFNLLAQ